MCSKCDTILIGIRNMGNKTATLHVRVSPEIKAEAEKLFAELGITTSYAVSMFLRQCIMRQAIPFPINKLEDKALEKEAIAHSINLTGGQEVDDEVKEIIHLVSTGKISYDTAALIFERKYSR